MKWAGAGCNRRQAGERGEENLLPFCSLLLLENHSYYSEGDTFISCRSSVPCALQSTPDGGPAHLCLDIPISVDACLASAILFFFF